MASVVKGLVKGLLGGGLLGAGVKAAAKAVAPGKKKVAAPGVPLATRDDAAATIDDELLRRRGGAADILTGATGAEAALSGGKLVLGN